MTSLPDDMVEQIIESLAPEHPQHDLWIILGRAARIVATEASGEKTREYVELLARSVEQRAHCALAIEQLRLLTASLEACLLGADELKQPQRSHLRLV